MSLRLDKFLWRVAAEFRPDYTAAETGLIVYQTSKKRVDFIGRACCRGRARARQRPHKPVAFEWMRWTPMYKAYASRSWLEGAVGRVLLLLAAVFALCRKICRRRALFPSHSRDGLASEIEILGQDAPCPPGITTRWFDAEWRTDARLNMRLFVVPLQQGAPPECWGRDQLLERCRRQCHCLRAAPCRCTGHGVRGHCGAAPAPMRGYRALEGLGCSIVSRAGRAEG